MTPRRALIGLHIGALAFGLSGIFGKLALAAPLAGALVLRKPYDLKALKAALETCSGP